MYVIRKATAGQHHVYVQFGEREKPAAVRQTTMEEELLDYGREPSPSFPPFLPPALIWSP